MIFSRLFHTAVQWTALTNEEKAVWALKAAEAPKKTREKIPVQVF